MEAMKPTREDVLRLLDEYARRQRPSARRPKRYLEAVARWEMLPEKAERTEKGWVLPADRSWRESMARRAAGGL